MHSNVYRTRILVCCILATFVVNVLGGRDFYKILGVPRNADEKSIKSAYRKLALKYHPDRVEEGERDKANAKFAEVANAYETLSDPEKRRMYDQVGEEGMKGGAGGQPDPSGFAHGAGGAGSSFSFSAGAGGFSDPQTIFNMFFGGGSGGAGAGMGGLDGMDAFAGMFGGGRGGRSSMGRGERRGGASAPADLYAGDQFRDVLQLDKGTFKSRVGKDHRGDKIIVLEFYSPSCGHCQALAPELGKLATALKGVLTVATVDCAAHHAICDAYHVAAYPTIKILHAGGSEDYTGPLRASAIRNAAVSKIPQRVATVGGEGPGSKVALEKLAKRCGILRPQNGNRATVGCVVLVSASPKDEVPPLLASLAADIQFDAQRKGQPVPGFHFVFMQAKGSGSRDARGKTKVADGAASLLGISHAPAMVILVGDDTVAFGKSLERQDLATASSAPGKVGGRLLFKGEITYEGARKWLLQQQKLLQPLALVRSSDSHRDSRDTVGEGQPRAKDALSSSEVYASTQQPTPDATVMDLLQCTGLNMSAFLAASPQLVEEVSRSTNVPAFMVKMALQRMISMAGMGSHDAAPPPSVCMLVVPQAPPGARAAPVLQLAAQLVAASQVGRANVRVLVLPAVAAGVLDGLQGSEAQNMGASLRSLLPLLSVLLRAGLGADGVRPERPSHWSGNRLQAVITQAVVKSLWNSSPAMPSSSTGSRAVPEAALFRPKKEVSRGALLSLPADTRSALLTVKEADQEGLAISIARTWKADLQACIQGDLPLIELRDLGLQALTLLSEDLLAGQPGESAADQGHEEL